MANPAPSRGPTNLLDYKPDQDVISPAAWKNNDVLTFFKLLNNLQQAATLYPLLDPKTSAKHIADWTFVETFEARSAMDTYPGGQGAVNVAVRKNVNKLLYTYLIKLLTPYWPKIDKALNALEYNDDASPLHVRDAHGDIVEPRCHIDCVQLGFHIPTLPPSFLPAGTPASFNFVIWSIILCLVFCSRRFVFFLLSLHFPLEDGFPFESPFLFELSELAIPFCWSRPTPHHPIFVRANCPFTFFSSSFVQTLPQENCWPLPFAPEFRCASPCTGEEGRCRYCRLSLQLHCGEQGLQGPQQPPCWRSISHGFEALL
jgi:hypothetical protein